MTPSVLGGTQKASYLDSPQEGLVYGVIGFGEVDEAHEQRVSFFFASSCRRRVTNIMYIVEGWGLKPHWSSGRMPSRTQ